MLFTSIEFLLLFFPIVLCGYYLLAKNIVWSNCWLLASSIFFYAWGEPKFVFIMIFSIVFNYVMALLIEKQSSFSAKKKCLLGLTVLVDLGVLVVFKYLNFVTGTICEFYPNAQEWITITKIALPIGISFFTFQALSYVVDVYRGIPAQKKLHNLGLYISLFPQLIAGPIVRYTTVMEQISSRHVDVDMFSKGAIRFLEGFNKKMLLANTFAVVADSAFGANNSIGMAWLGAFCYTLQIFFDFSGYSDMAIGLGCMFGFKFLENFDYPYISKTVTEFWRRWHISLGSWFRDYVYFPLGGSKVTSNQQMIFNLFVVWTLTGIWHGANWTFILWGMLYGVIITFEKLFNIPYKINKSSLIYQYGYGVFTFVAVMCGWVLFRSETITGATIYLKTMFGMTSSILFDKWFLFNLQEYGLFLIAGILCSTPMVKYLLESAYRKNISFGKSVYGIYAMLQLVLFVVSFSFLVMNAHNPFIYFNF